MKNINIILLIIFIPVVGNCKSKQKTTTKIKPKTIIKRKLNPNIITIAGTGRIGYGGDNGPAKNALLNKPHRVFVHGNFIYVADTLNHAIRRINKTTGIIETIAGGHGLGYLNNRDAKKAKICLPTDLFVDNEYVYFVEFGTHTVRRFPVNGGKIELIAGIPWQPGFSGDGGSALRARLNKPHGIYVKHGVVYVADTLNHCIRMFKIGGKIQTIAGVGGERGYNPDGTKAAETKMYEPVSVYVYNDFVYVAEYGNNVVRKFKPGGRIITVAGNRHYGFKPDGKPAKKTAFRNLHSVYIYKGYVYVADMNNHAIRRFSLKTKKVETLCGGNGGGYSGDNGNPLRAKLNTPPGLCVAGGYVYFTEYVNNTVRRFAVPETK